MKRLTLILCSAALAGPALADSSLEDLYLSYKSAHEQAPEWLVRELFGEQTPVDASREGGEGPADAVVLDPSQASIVHTGNSCNSADYFSLSCEDGLGNGQCTNAYPNIWDDPEGDNFFPNFGSLYGNWYFLNTEDWFTFTLPCPGTFTLDMCGNNNYDTCIGLLDAAQNPLVIVDDWYNCPIDTYYGSMEVALPAGTYYALVGGYDNNCGNYEAVFGFDLDCNSAGTEDRPVAFELEQNYPNPFNPGTTLSFSLTETTDARLTVTDLTGRTVATLVDGLTAAGSHQVEFDASALASGVYMYTLEANGHSESRKMVLVK